MELLYLFFSCVPNPMLFSCEAPVMFCGLKPETELMSENQKSLILHLVAKHFILSSKSSPNLYEEINIIGE